MDFPLQYVHYIDDGGLCGVSSVSLIEILVVNEKSRDIGPLK